MTECEPSYQPSFLFNSQRSGGAGYTAKGLADPSPVLPEARLRFELAQIPFAVESPDGSECRGSVSGAASDFVLFFQAHQPSPRHFCSRIYLLPSATRLPCIVS